jgi:hypothetical protein
MMVTMMIVMQITTMPPMALPTIAPMGVFRLPPTPPDDMEIPDESVAGAEPDSDALKDAVEVGARTELV